MSCRTSTRLLANECMAALIGSTVRWMDGEWILRFKWGTICYFWLADCFWTVGECLFVAENAYTWRYLENTVSKIGGKILDLQPLVSVIMSQSWAPYCGLFAHETVGFHDFWDSSRFVLSLETRNLATVVYLGLSQVASTLGTPKSYGLPSVYPVKLLAEHVSFRDKPLLCRWCGKSLDGFVSRISCCLDLFKKGRKFPLSCPCYHPQYVSTIFRISPLLVDKSYITSLGFSENSAPPDLNRFSRHSLLKLLWDVVGIPHFFPGGSGGLSFAGHRRVASEESGAWLYAEHPATWRSVNGCGQRTTDNGKVSRVHWPIEYPWRMIFMAYIIT